MGQSKATSLSSTVTFGKRQKQKAKTNVTETTTKPTTTTSRFGFHFGFHFGVSSFLYTTNPPFNTYVRLQYEPPTKV